MTDRRRGVTTQQRISVGQASLASAPHALYRFYDRTDVLLYVGITMNLPTRMFKHKGTKPWWTSIADIQVEHFATRGEALTAERKAIREERPLYNEQHNRFVDVQASDPGRLYAACEDCGALLADDDGVLHINQLELREREDAYRQYERRQDARGSWAPVDFGDLLSLPDEATWRVQCDNCAQCEFCYDIDIGRALTWPELMDWTVHLSEKSWIEYTNWFALMRSVAHGRCKFLSATPIPARDPWDESSF
jgi:predicted GIY-YIG superfamily endonuclease